MHYLTTALHLLFISLRHSLACSPDTAFDCANQILTASTTSCNPLLSCYNTTFASNNGSRNTFGGAGSGVISKSYLGAYLSISADGHLSNAFNSIDFIDDVSNSKYINAYGGASLIHSNITISTNPTDNPIDYVRVGGYGSVINVNGLNVLIKQFYAQSYAGLGSSMFNLSYNSSVYLQSRFSAINSTFYCQNGNICNIFCQTPSACYGMNLICDPDSTCNIDCNETLGISCPNTDITNNKYVTFIESFYDPTFISSQTIETLDILNFYNDSCFFSCIDNCPSSLSYDVSNISTDITSGTMCFLSTNAGQQASYVNISGYDIAAFASNSLYQSDIIIADTIYGLGYQSLTNINYIESNNGVISCQAYQSCSDINIIYGADQLHCLGGESCINIELITGVNSVYLVGKDAGSGSVINSNHTNNGILEIYIDLYASDDYELNINCLGNDSCIIYCFNDGNHGMPCYGINGLNFTCSEDADCSIKLKRATNAPTTLPTQAPIATQVPSNAPSDMPVVGSTNIPTEMPVEDDSIEDIVITTPMTTDGNGSSKAKYLNFFNFLVIITAIVEIRL